ncbi:hypothetical protein Hanom_Chr10g00934361 [Helianthus anomalus]
MPFWSYMHLNYVLLCRMVAASFFVHMDPRSMQTLEKGALNLGSKQNHGSV